MAKFHGFEFISPDKWLFMNNAEVEKAAQRAAEYAERNFNFDNLEQHIEEYLRQWALAQLIEVYGYPENWLWLAKASKRNANIVIKDETNRSLALVAARYFGDSDLEFEQAGHDLQSDLEDIETVRFGIVTDGRRIAFLCKNSDEQIGDYKTIADFPNYLEFKSYLETNQLPALPATTHKFQKLPAPKRSSKPVSATVSQATEKMEPPATVSSKFQLNRSNRRTIAAILGMVLLILLGAWYITRSEPRVNGQTSASDEIQTEKTDSPNLKTNEPLDKSPSISRRQGHNAPKQTERRAIDLDGRVILNRKDMSVMQSRPTVIPSSGKPEPKVAQPTSTLPSNRKIIAQPYTN
ncbi:MAG: hypothetical protein ABI954_09760 [Pyrinomonadaceae bacterium]